MALLADRITPLTLLLHRIEIGGDAIREAQRAADGLWPTIERKVTEGKIPGHLEVFPTGSFSRATKNFPLDDIDFFYVFGRAQRLPNIESYQLTHMPYTFADDFYGLLGENLSSIKVTNLFKRAIAETYSRSGVARDGECVNIFLESYGFGFDMVPAIFIENTGYYIIPRAGGSDRWKPANPKKDTEILDALDRFHNFRIRQVIRIAKHWFRKKRISSPRSYHLEAAIYHLFSACKTPITTLQNALVVFFQNVNYQNNLLYCSDPTGFPESLTSGLDFDDILRITMEAVSAVTSIQSGEAAFVRYIEPDR